MNEAMYGTRAPATKSSVKVRNVSTTALPKSGCLRHRSARTPTTIRWGRKPTEKLLILSAFLDERIREPEHDAELGRLRRLDVDGADGDPPEGVARAVAEARHDQHQHGRDHEEDGIGEHLEPAVVEAAREPHPHDGGEGIGGLPLEEELGVVVAHRRLDGAGAVDHHHAEADEGDHQRREHRVDGPGRARTQQRGRRSERSRKAGRGDGARRRGWRGRGPALVPPPGPGAARSPARSRFDLYRTTSRCRLLVAHGLGEHVPAMFVVTEHVEARARRT